MYKKIVRKLFLMSAYTLLGCLISLYFTTVLVAESSSAQNVDEVAISVDLDEVTIPEAFMDIESKTTFMFVYSKSAVEREMRRITLKYHSATVEEILQEISRQTGARFRQLGQTIAAGFPSEVESVVEVLQEVVRGTVRDANTNESLPGVNILLRGSDIGATTNARGEYQLTVPNLGETLIFSYIGYQSQEIPLQGRENLDVYLQPQQIMGQELIVVGYGVAREAMVTGSVSTVDISSAIGSRPATNVGSLLQGHVPGLFIQADSGQPGQEGLNILVRGVGTMGDSQPLVIVDGVESSMDNINPNDIESISILKDASSAAIYGTRAAHGVILINTKRGRPGPVQVTYNTYVGLQQPTNYLNFLGSADYARLHNEARQNVGLSPTFSADAIARYEAGNDPDYPSTDWERLFYDGSGLTHYHNLAFRGGTDATRYNISAGFMQQEGVINSVGSDRYNLRVNLDNDIGDRFRLGINSSFSNTINTIPLTGPDLIRHGELTQFYNSIMHIPPTQKVRLEDGTWSGEYPLGNPIAWIDAGNLRSDEITRLSGTVFGDLELTDKLLLSSSASADYGFTETKRHTAEIFYGGGQYTGPPSNRVDLMRSFDLDLESMLRFEDNFGNHGVRGLVGVSRRSEDFESTMAYRIGFPSNDLQALNAGSTDGLQNAGTFNTVTLGSYFGRINYDYDERYLLEANLRRDGSSKFARGNRWGWFPSVSVGWIISGEEFMRDVDWLNFMRVRGSWGTLGNHRIANYIYQPRISLGQDYPFGGQVVSGAVQTQANNPDITWETTTETNFGLDMEFFQNRFRVNIDAYNRYTDDILTTIPVSQIFGLPAPVVNAGAMSNKGVELQLSYFNVLGDLQYDITFNGSYNKNNTERYHGRSVLSSANPGGDMVRMEGIPWNSYFGYEWIGYFMSDQEAQDGAVHNPNVGAGDLRFRDQNNDGVIDGNDRVVLGNPIPEYTYGINLGLRYKGIDFAAFFQGVENVQRFVRTRGYMPFMRNGKAREVHLDRMIVENGQVVQTGYFPKTRLEGGPGDMNVQSSSFLIHDASYLRLKNLQIGYTLPARWLNFLSLSNVRVYFTGQNLFTITGFPEGYDPEASTKAFHGFQHGGAAGWDYPQVRMYTMGLDINF